MARRTVPERVKEYIKKHPEAYDMRIADANQIRELGDTLEIVCTAFAYGYMKGSKAKKDGAKA